MDVEVDAFAEDVQSHTSDLLDTAHFTRRRELERIKALVQAVPALVLQETAVEPVAQLLLPRCEDASEKCRELALTTLLLVVLRAPPSVLALLPYVLPVLRDRLAPAGAALRETSEELRLLLVQLTMSLVAGAEGALPAYLGECVEVVEGALGDEAPEVAAHACLACCALCDALGRRLGSANALRLARRATVQTGHTRAAVRLAALDALRSLVHAGAHEHLLVLAAFRHPNQVDVAAFYGAQQAQVNFLGKLACDRSPAVRLRLLRVAADWLLTLQERADHAPRLLPYVLAGLSDGAADVAAAAAEALHRLGCAYEEEHAEELRELQAHCPDALHGKPLVNDGGLALPPPPRLGTRLLVQESLATLLPPCLADLRVWADGVRPRAIALLATLLRHSEQRAARHAPALVPALCAAAADEDACVAAGALQCCRLLAQATPPDAWLPPLMLASRAPPCSRDAVSRVTAALCEASSPCSLEPHRASLEELERGTL